MSKLDDVRQRAADTAQNIDAVTASIEQRRAAMERSKVAALAKPAKGRLATGWFAAWSRQVGTLAQSVARLDRLRARLPRLVAQAETLALRGKREGEKQQRRDAFIASMIPRLDALRAAAPAVAAQWKADRKNEKKRIKALKQKLRDRQADPAPARAAPEPTREEWLAPSVMQPIDVSAEFTPSVRPPCCSFSLLDAAPLPARWDARQVGARLIEAQRVVRMLPESIGPRSFGKAWPEYVNEVDHDGEQETGRFRPRAGPAEIARATEAISWPIQFLTNRGRYSIALLNYWAAEAESADVPNAPTDLLEVIAAALNAAKEPVR